MMTAFERAIAQINEAANEKRVDVVEGFKSDSNMEQDKQNTWAGAIVYIASYAHIKALSSAWLSATVGSSNLMDKTLFNAGMRKAAAWWLAMRSLEEETGAPFHAACVLMSDLPNVTMLESAVNLFADGIDFSEEYAELVARWNEQAGQIEGR